MRETAKHRREREELEIAASISRKVEEYPDRLIDALHRASEHGFTITVNKSKEFVIAYCNEWNDVESIFIPHKVNSATQPGVERFEFNQLIHALRKKDELVAEANRKAEIRKSAIAKLTDEERLELGIGKY